MRKKILIAVGGTGGHLFPAQLLARELKEKESELEIFFGGNRLSSNPFFDKKAFDFREIKSSSPFQKNPFTSTFHLGHGVLQSFSLFSKFLPDLVIGFGSFYSFPLLMTAYLKKIPYILVESNGFPGKVNRLFSSKALFSTLQFEEAKNFLKGKTKQVTMPFPTNHSISKEEARKFYGLDQNLFTLLVFGGSQGAQPINEAAVSLKLNFPYQVLHFGGDKELLELRYKEKGIQAHVKPFEKQMHMAWRGADLAICRAGAATMTEMLHFHVPAILVPWPKAADQHQRKNAKIVKDLGGALLLEQNHLIDLSKKIEEAKEHLEEMEQSLQKFGKHKPLSEFILEELST